MAAAEEAKTEPKVPPEVQERLGDRKELDGVSEDELKAILKEYYDKWV